MNKIFIKHPGKSTTICIFTKMGARYEQAKYKGISHVLEHMMFKGTHNRTANQIAKEIEQYGAYFNAFTDWEVTAYWVKIANEYASKGIEILHDMLCHSTLVSKELNKEMKVILEELKMGKDNPREYVWELFYRNLTKEKDGFHQPGIGTVKSLANIDRDTLVNFYKNYYNQNQLTLLVVGNIDIPEINKDIETEIPKINTVQTKVKEKVFVEYVRNGIQQSNMIIGNMFKNDRPKIDNYFLCYILCSLLNDMSGRLFKEVREKHNLVYRVGFDSEPYRCGNILWSVSLGLDKQNINKAYKIINKQLITLKDCSNEELDYAINKLIGQFALSLDDSFKIANKILYAESLGIDFRKIIYSYADEIKRVSKDFRNFVADINFNNALTTILSPKGEIYEKKKI